MAHINTRGAGLSVGRLGCQRRRRSVTEGGLNRFFTYVYAEPGRRFAPSLFVISRLNIVRYENARLRETPSAARSGIRASDSGPILRAALDVEHGAQAVAGRREGNILLEVRRVDSGGHLLYSADGATRDAGGFVVPAAAFARAGSVQVTPRRSRRLRGKRFGFGELLLR